MSGVRLPPQYCVNRRRPHAGRENPRTPLHPYTTATQSYVSVGSATVAVDGQGLNLCFGVWRG
jgi:hypothetical protein